jgi:hypothetical protein
LRAPLNEQNQEYQHQDLGKHRALERFDKLVDDAQAHRGDKRPPKIADAPQHHDEETVDNVVLAEIGADIVDLAQRNAGHAGDAGTEAKSECVDHRRADAHYRRHAPVLHHGSD